MCMKSLPYVVFILLTLAVGGLSSLAVAAGMPVYAQLVKPPLTPPSLLFPIAWTLLYILMAVGAAQVWNSASGRRQDALTLYFVQLALNALWSVWFFALQARLFAFFWLLALIAAIVRMIRSFSQINRIAGRLQIPYLLWCSFAAYLNFGVWLLNR